MVKAAVLGATGYAGAELVRLLSGHPDTEIVYLASHSYAGKKFSDIYPGMRSVVDMVLSEDSIEAAASVADVVFLALPAGIASKSVTEDILSKAKIIDLGADFRLHDKDTYETWYKVEHFGEKLLGEAVYGLPEIHREKIRGKRLVANPGCYTTCSILTLYPLIRSGLIDTGSVIIDALSGTTGAGRSEKTTSLFCEVNETVKAYGVANHRHTPEIEQELVAAAYSMYDGEKFIRLVDTPPETRYVKGTNTVDIGYRIDHRTGNIISMGAIDNLVKGAAGQAVQNMNILFSLDEAEGLSVASASTF